MYVLLNYNNNTKEFTILDTKDSSVETLGINTMMILADKNISLYVCTSYSDFKSYQIKELLLNPMILYNFIAVSPVDSTNRTFISLDGTKTYQLNNQWGISKGLPENLLKEWNYEKNADLKDGNGKDISTPDKVTRGSRHKVWWKCSTCGYEWQARIQHRSNGVGCPYCFKTSIGEKISKATIGKNDLATLRPDLVAEWNFEKNVNLKPTDVRYGSGQKVWWKCKKCGHEWQAVICSRSNGVNCPYCNASETEKEVHKILQNLNVKFVIEKSFDSIEIYHYEYDIYLPDSNLIIELDDRDHFIKSIIDTRRIDNHKRDNAKNIFCLENNTPILRIPYPFLKDENTDVLEYIIKDFHNTQIVPDLIIKFYADYEFSNYAEVATKLNEYVKSKQNAALAVV